MKVTGLISGVQIRRIFTVVLKRSFFVHRLSQFRSSLVKVFSSSHSQSLPISDLTDQVNSGQSVKFSGAEIQNALEQMQDANQVMVSENVVFLI